MADRAHDRRHGIVNVHAKRKNEIRVQEHGYERGKTLRNVGNELDADKNHMAAARRPLPRQNEYGADNMCTGATRESQTYSTRLRTN